MKAQHFAPLGKSCSKGDNLVRLTNNQVVDITEKDGEMFSGFGLRLQSVRATTSHLTLPWSKVGVHRFCGLDLNMKVTFKREDIVCKLMICGDYIYEWYPEWTSSKMT